MKATKTTRIVFVDDTHAQVTKVFAKNARIFGTDEYRLWKEYRKEYPDAVMVTKEIKRNPDKKTNRNMNYPNMRAFIHEQENGEEMLVEFERQVRLSKIQSCPYQFVLAWFLSKYATSKDYFREFPTQDKEATATAVNN